MVTPQHRFVAWLLALALVAAQGLGLAHRILHAVAPGLGQGSVPATAWADAHRDAAADLSPEVFGGHEEGGAECRLLDQAAHGDSLIGSETPVLQWQAPPQRAGWVETAFAAAAAVAYRARGPPAPAAAGS